MSDRLSCSTRSALLSYDVLSLFIITKYLPWNKFIRLLAGNTVRDVPATINISALCIAFCAFMNASSGSGSSYKTTSGFIIPPHVHVGILLDVSTYSAEYSFEQSMQWFL